MAGLAGDCDWGVAGGGRGCVVYTNVWYTNVWKTGLRGSIGMRGTLRIAGSKVFPGRRWRRCSAVRSWCSPDPGHSLTARRFRCIGRSRDGRTVFVVFTIRERGGRRMIRPISARYMHRKEIERYAEDNSGL